MGYQNVGTPRFFIDTLLFYRSQGIGKPDADDNVFSLNPSGGVSRNFGSAGDGNDGRAWLDYRFDSPTSLGAINYIAFLGHDQANAHTLTFRHPGNGDNMQDLNTSNTVTEYVNYNVPGGGGLNGFTIGLVDYDSATGTFDDNSADFNDPSGEMTVSFAIYGEDADGTPGNMSKGQPFRIGSASIGRVYDMPHSPDLSLTMSHEYDGIKQVTTKGGSTLSNANYYKPPMWDENREAWQLGDFPYYYNGRRTWDLSFSYISDSDIEPYSYYGNKYTSDTDLTNPTIEEGGDNWFQDVIRMTQGGHLPFIFSPDPSIEYYNDGTNPPRVPEFAICRFDMNTFKRTQVAHKMYTISVKLRETW